jgi:exosortase H (IPTLxxWG-CTERM-specific)
VEAVLLLAAAVIAYPSSLKLKVLGIALGFVAIQAVNLVRIITLYYMADWTPQIFEFFHLYLWQALIMLDVLVVWLVWLKQVGKEEGRKDKGNGPGGSHVVAA